MRDYGDARRIDLVDALQNLRALMCHGNQCIRQADQAVHHRALFGIGLFKYGMQRGDDRHVQPFQQCQQVATGRTAIDAELVLYEHHVCAALIQFIGQLAIAIDIVLGQLVRDFARIVVGRAGLIHRNDPPRCIRHGLGQAGVHIAGEGCQAALPGREITDYRRTGNAVRRQG